MRKVVDVKRLLAEVAQEIQAREQANDGTAQPRRRPMVCVCDRALPDQDDTCVKCGRDLA